MRLIIMVCICGVMAATAAAQEAPAVPEPGWLDRDGDGRHDLFQDRDGDGVNDVTRQRYAHRFLWIDQDGDAVNDIWRDADGDGVNDLEISFRDRDGDGRDDNVLDLDNDGVNDVTGRAYGRDELHGDEFGYVVDGGAWIDEDGDGFADAATGGHRDRGRQDRFIDSDGDGMADDCWFEDGGFRHHRARTGQGGGVGGPGGPGGPGGGNQWRGGGSSVNWSAQ